MWKLLVAAAVCGVVALVLASMATEDNGLDSIAYNVGAAAVLCAVVALVLRVTSRR